MVEEIKRAIEEYAKYVSEEILKLRKEEVEKLVSSLKEWSSKVVEDVFHKCLMREVIEHKRSLEAAFRECAEQYVKSLKEIFESVWEALAK